MKILFVTEFFPISDGGEISGGAESRTYYLAKKLSINHNVTVITSLLDNSLVGEKWDKLNIIRVGPRRNYVRRSSLIERGLFGLAIIKKIISTDFDIIDANNSVVYFFSYIGAKIKNKKLVYWIPDIVGLPEWQREQGLLGGFIARILELTAVLFLPNKIIALSNTTKEKLVKLNVNQTKIDVIYPGV